MGKSVIDITAAHIADVAAAAGDPASKAEYDAFAVKFNAVLTALENIGVLAKS